MEEQTPETTAEATPEPAEATPGGYATFTTDDGFEIGSNTVTAEEMAERLGKPKDEDEDDSGEPKEGSEERPADAPKKRSARDRMLQATQQAAAVKRQLAEREEELSRLRSELEAARRGATPQQPREQQPQQPSEEKELDPSDFPTWDAYNKALIRQEARKEAQELYSQQMQTQRIEMAAHAAAQETIKTVETFAERTKVLRDETGEMEPAVDWLVSNLVPTAGLDPNQEPTSTNDLTDLIMESELAPTIIRHLANNHEDLKALIASENYRVLTRAFGRLEERLSRSQSAPQAAPVRRAPAVSRAPAPVKPVQTGSTGGEPDPRSMNEDDYIEWRQRQDRQKVG